MDENTQHAGDPDVGPRRPSLELQAAQLSDAELLGRISRGDRAAFEELYDRFAAPVHGLVLAVVDDAEQAAQVVADLFVDLWRSPLDLPSSPGAAPSRFSTRLLAAAHRRAVEAVRVRRQGPSAGDDPDRDVSGQAARVLDDIPDPDELAALQLAYFDARTIDEIAERMEVPLSRVADLLNHGLEALRRTSHAR